MWSAHWLSGHSIRTLAAPLANYFPPIEEELIEK